jgi:16S rRNA (guanine966-N2)-methyltransferase
MSLKIISGVYKGRVLQAPKGLGVRPTTGRVRQRVFDTLQALWPGSIGLDAFAGSGAIGFEALSRGAQQVTACEFVPLHAECIRRNQQALGVSSTDYILHTTPCEAWLNAHGATAFPLMDWVYLDPPYGYVGLPNLLEALATQLPPTSFLIVEHGASPTEVQHLEALQARHPRVTLHKQIEAGDSAVHIFVVG